MKTLSPEQYRAVEDFAFNLKTYLTQTKDKFKEDKMLCVALDFVINSINNELGATRIKLERYASEMEVAK